jgi:hypothetical protein
MMVQMRDRAERSGDSLAGQPVTCEEFQAQMPGLIGGVIRDHGHLKTCTRCAALLEELEYIAKIASDLLLPVHEPGDAVWKKISAALPNSPDKAVKINGHFTGARSKG